MFYSLFSFVLCKDGCNLSKFICGALFGGFLLTELNGTKKVFRFHSHMIFDSFGVDRWTVLSQEQILCICGAFFNTGVEDTNFAKLWLKLIELWQRDKCYSSLRTLHKITSAQDAINMLLNWSQITLESTAAVHHTQNLHKLPTRTVLLSMSTKATWVKGNIYFQTFVYDIIFCNFCLYNVLEVIHVWYCMTWEP